MMDFSVDMVILPRNQLHWGKAYGKMVLINRNFGGIVFANGKK